MITDFSNRSSYYMTQESVFFPDSVPYAFKREDGVWEVWWRHKETGAWSHRDQDKVIVHL